MKMRKNALLPVAVALSVVGLVAWTAVGPTRSAGRSDPIDSGAAAAAAADRVNELLQATWTENALEPASRADDLQVYRRLALALIGTTPSLEEIRQFEADRSPDRLQQWTSRFIADSRFVEYFAARLGDAFVDPLAEDLKPHQRGPLLKRLFP